MGRKILQAGPGPPCHHLLRVGGAGGVEVGGCRLHILRAGKPTLLPTAVMCHDMTDTGKGAGMRIKTTSNERQEEQHLKVAHWDMHLEDTFPCGLGKLSPLRAFIQA